MAKSLEQRLESAVERLTDEDRRTLVEFAEFLAERRPRPPAELPSPKDIPRPEQESVVAALKRLSQTYFMIDKSRILHESSALMSEHLMWGRSAVEVIDELEVVFRRQYERHVEERGE